MVNMSSELLPCPCCGAPAAVGYSAFRELNDILDVHRLLFAKCDKQGCCAPKRLDHDPYRW